MEEIKRYEGVMKSNIEYSLLVQGNLYNQKGVEEIFSLILEILCGKRETVWIVGAMQPIQLVKSRFLKLNYEHIQYVLECLHKNPAPIRNIKSYLLTTLFNAASTMNQYY